LAEVLFTVQCCSLRISLYIFTFIITVKFTKQREGVEIEHTKSGLFSQVCHSKPASESPFEYFPN